MPYPHFRERIDFLNRKYRLDPAKVSPLIKKDKSTAWRWLFQRPNSLKPEEQDLLVSAICTTLDKPGLTPESFRNNYDIAFCRDAGISKFELAVFSGLSLPVPEIFIDSLFDPGNDPRIYAGHYLLYRHEKEPQNDPPFIQACATIAADANQLATYTDIWGDNNSRQSYVGFVFSVGTFVNIIGQSTSMGRNVRPEIWWCGLRPTGVNSKGEATPLVGYVSDITQTGILYTDRLVLVRTTEVEQNRIRDNSEFYVDRARVAQIAGEDATKYLEAWMRVPI
jgi:hypothetical protein